MIQKTVTIGEREVTFRSSATIPRLYRVKFKRDIFKDLSKLEKSYKGKAKSGGSFEIEDLEIFENVAYPYTNPTEKQLEAMKNSGVKFQTISVYEMTCRFLCQLFR